MIPLTQQLAEFINTLEYKSLPATAVETVKRGMIDCLGVMLAGRDEAAVRLAMPLLLDERSARHARLLFDRGMADSADAALVNGIAAHVLDYDDVALDGHPSVVLVPAVLAEAERLGVGGKSLISAYVAGYETWAELIARDADRHHAKGWHPTAVFGTIAAAAAAAHLARLSATETACALGLAASMAGGLVANFGTMTKAFQAGRAAQSGVLAARLAAHGFTATGDALEHPQGFLHAVSPAGHLDLVRGLQAGADWHILRHGLNVKRYPLCYCTHRVVDAVLGLRSDQAPGVASVAAVEVAIGRNQVIPLREHRPLTPLQAKFSLEFAVAAALLAGRVGLAELSEQFVTRPAVQSLMSKVQAELIDDPDPDEPLFSRWDRVRIRLADGSVLSSASVRHARGHARNPISFEELVEKFSDCARDALPAARRSALVERLWRLETLPSVAALYSA
jgi:2-methylcitrate dehydratase PrpD